jgi:hypothetical protein
METPKEGGENEKRQKQQKHKTQKLRRGSHGEQRKQLSVQELAVVVYWQKLVFQPVDPQRVQLSGAAQSGAAPLFLEQQTAPPLLPINILSILRIDIDSHLRTMRASFNTAR